MMKNNKIFSEKYIINMTRRRLVGGLLDLTFFILGLKLIAHLYEWIMDILGLSILSASLFAVLLIFMVVLISLYLFFIFYFGVITKLTKGFTLGGFITGIKVVYLDKSDVKILKVCKRFYDLFNFYVKFFYSQEIKVNNIGQFGIDEKFGTTVILIKDENSFFDQIKKFSEKDIVIYEHDFTIFIWSIFLFIMFFNIVIEITF